HLLGAAGGIESIFTVLATMTDQLPPTLNLEQVDEALQDLDLVPLHSRQARVQHALCNGFGFGGVNAALLVSKWLDWRGGLWASIRLTDAAARASSAIDDLCN